MDDATTYEFKLLFTGIGLLVAGAILLGSGDPAWLLGAVVSPAGALAIAAGFVDQTGRFD